MDSEKYKAQLSQFMADSSKQRPEFSTYYSYPCLEDDTKQTGFDSHYLYHVAWAVRKLLTATPETHCDVGSSLNFCSIASAIVPTTFIDIRPANIYLNNLLVEPRDLTVDESWKNEEFGSLSCMHVIEHIGLGRYGDNLDVSGDLKAINNLLRAVKKNGQLFFVVPVGKPEIYFNAHRVYSSKWIIEYFSSKCTLNEFYFIPAQNDMAPVENCDPEYADKFTYGCGCFHFIKK
ncbi:MAG: DUF268 domain-containing protein [Polynucleobacter sp.]|nr:DUF268 domain-containing protein [Polynucleobacter sp.]